MPIKIISISNFDDPNPKVERMEPDGDFIVKEKIEEMTLLNTGRVHFDLIRKKKKSTKVPDSAPQDCPKVLTPSSLESPSRQVLKETSQPAPQEPGNEEIYNLRIELAESKEEIRALKELVKQLVPCEETEKLGTKTTSNSLESKDRAENNVCSDCGKGFSELISLEAHVIQEHNEENSFECKTCRSLYSTKENLWAHITQNHERKFNCDSCEQSFQNEQELKLHDDEDHMNNYDCDQCDYQSHSQVSLNKHTEHKHTEKDNAVQRSRRQEVWELF